MTAYPDALAIRLKVNAIQQKFAETYKHEPVLEYFENFTEIDVCQSVLNGNVLLWKLSTEETQKKLAKLYRRQYELEKYILGRHKKNSYPE